MKKTALILGIETSCDDTSVAVLKGRKVLSNIVFNQQDHKKFGGVVPELASRMHMEKIVSTVDLSLKKAGVNKHQIDGVAYANGPGLMGSLLVGSMFAQSFALALGIPHIPVNHMQAHILVNFIYNSKGEYPSFPFLSLTVSGGHTELVKVTSFFDFEIIGKTLDDAAGEAFDKIAKMCNLKYPGGPLIDEYAKSGNPLSFKFAKPEVAGYDYSFSGLKTSVLYFLNKQNSPDFIKNNINDICASVQYTIVQVLLKKMIKALEKENIHQLCLGGGVSANSSLREATGKICENKNIKLYLPEIAYCTDNGAMIALVGSLAFEKEKYLLPDQFCSPFTRNN